MNKQLQALPLFLALLLSGCSASGTIVPIASTQTHPFFADSKAAASGPNLYVSNAGNSTVTVYGLANGKLLQKIKNGVNKPVALAPAPLGNIAVVNSAPLKPIGGKPIWGKTCAAPTSGDPVAADGGSVSLFAPGAARPAMVLGNTCYPQGVVFDSHDTPYILNRWMYGYMGRITVYASGSTSPTQRFGKPSNLVQPDALALEPSGRLYVVNRGAIYQSKDDFVSVFTLPSNKFLRNIDLGITYPQAIAISAGRFYLANVPPKENGGYRPHGSVTVYPLDAKSNDRPIMTITAGIHYPTALAFDGAGNLYVANLNGRDVTVYAPNSKIPMRVITVGTTSPNALAISKKGTLYVANLRQNTITVYKPSSNKPILTITKGVNRPNAILLSGQ